VGETVLLHCRNSGEIEWRTARHCERTGRGQDDKGKADRASGPTSKEGRVSRPSRDTCGTIRAA